MQTTRHLPLFPLHTVLFPGVPLPLRVFEERYKLMVKRCLEEDGAMGIVLIRSGSEVGAPAVPYDVGTLARITRVDKKNDGTLSVTTVGERRFRIRSVDGSQPYAVGDVELLDDEQPDVPDRLLNAVRDRFTAYVQLLRRLARQDEGDVPIPHGALDLSHVVAANLQIGRVEQQLLLEDPPSERLRHEHHLLRRELTIVERLGSVVIRRMISPGEIPPN